MYPRDHRFRYAGNIIHLKTRAKTSQPAQRDSPKSLSSSSDRLKEAQRGPAPASPSQHRERSSRESRSASRALMRDVQGGIRLTHPAHVLDTSHTYSHVPPLMRSPHHGNCIPSGHARRKHSLQTVCINRSLPAASASIDLFLRTVFDHSLTEMQHILRACPLFLEKKHQQKAVR